MKELKEKFANFLRDKLSKTNLSTKDIAQELKIEPRQIEKLLLSKHEGYKIFTLPDKGFQSMVYRAVSSNLIPAPGVRESGTRIWDYIPIKELFPGRNIVAPLHFVQIYADVPKIKIYFFADFHFGGEGFEEKGFQECINTVKNKEHALMVAVGDVLEMALKDSIGSVYGQQLRPHDQVVLFRDEIKPVAHKVLLMMPGNHENRVIKAADIDPLEIGICDYYGIPYFNEPTIMVVSWKNLFFTFYFRHGKSGSTTPGGKLNAAARPLSFLPHIQFVVMAHVHTPTSGINIRRCRKYIYDEKGDLINFEIEKKEEHLAICASNHRYFASYSSREEYAPTITSMAIACILYPDGRYHLEKKLVGKSSFLP